MAKVTTLTIPSTMLEKWLHQNKAKCVGDFVEGCLLDNFVVMTKRGFAAIYEHYVNPNASDYRVEFQAGPAQDVFRNWYAFEAAAEASMANI